MADAPESPPRADESKTRVSERPLDVDVSSSAGPYPRPPRSGLRKLWLAAAGAAMVLGLTWMLFSSSGEEPALPPPPPLPDPASTSPVMAATEPAATEAAAPEAASPEAGASEVGASEAAATEAASSEPAPPEAAAPEAAPSEATTTEAAASLARPTEEAIDFAPVPDQPADRPPASQDMSQPATSPAKPATAKAKPVEKPARATAPAKPVEKPAAASPLGKPADGTSQSSDKWWSDKWVVNISSTPDAAESLRFLSDLLARDDVGGKVYASEATLEGRTQHRIRVGFFETREEAEAVGLKIKEQYQLYATPWAVRPSKEEESKYGGGR